MPEARLARTREAYESFDEGLVKDVAIPTVDHVFMGEGVIYMPPSVDTDDDYYRSDDDFHCDYWGV